MSEDTFVICDTDLRIDLIDLVQTRAFFQKIDLTDEQIDLLAWKLKHTLTWDFLFGQVDTAIWNFCDEFNIDTDSKNDPRPHYGEIQPEPGREAELVKREKEQKAREKYVKDNFDMVELVAPAWTITVPIRKKDA